MPDLEEAINEAVEEAHEGAHEETEEPSHSEEHTAQTIVEVQGQLEDEAWHQKHSNQLGLLMEHNRMLMEEVRENNRLQRELLSRMPVATLASETPSEVASQVSAETEAEEAEAIAETEEAVPVEIVDANPETTGTRHKRSMHRNLAFGRR